MTPALSEIARLLRKLYPDARYELDWQTPEQLLVGTMLAGGSKDSAVNQVTGALFARWPTPRALAEADPAEVEALLKPLGLGKLKTERIQATCLELHQRFGGKVPPSLEQLIELPGIGRKTANVVLTQGLAVASGIIVDVHVTRLAHRLGLSSKDEPDEIEQQLLPQLPQSQWIHFGAAAVLHGRRVCTAKAPRCAECALLELCPRIGVPAAAVSAPAAPEPATGDSAWPDAYQLPQVRSGPEQPEPSSPLVEAASLPADWEAVLSAELSSGWYRVLTQQLTAERAAHTVFPPPPEVFTAFHLTPIARTRVLILGQDPYHGPNQGHGLAFSVKDGVKPPPSLANIYKELAKDVGCTIPTTGNLTPWAEQGVLLLNAVLTVRQGEANSHQGLGWEKLTDAVIRQLSARAEHLVFVLWGAWARKKAALIDRDRHTVVEGAHPSPLSAKLWFGSRPFSTINQALQSHDQAPIDWQLKG